MQKPSLILFSHGKVIIWGNNIVEMQGLFTADDLKKLLKKL